MVFTMQSDFCQVVEAAAIAPGLKEIRASRTEVVLRCEISSISEVVMEKMQHSRVGRIVETAAARGTFVPAFNIPYLPVMEPVVRTLAECDAIGMVQVALLEITKFGAQSVAAIAEEYRRVGDPRYATLHLDHTPVIDEDGKLVDWKPIIAEAVSLGYDSVMVDGSRLTLDENIRVTGEVVRLAHANNVMVEAELGSVVGHEAGPTPPYEELFASKAGFTIPDEARRFVEETGVDWLSVSVGSVHGAIAPAKKNEEKIRARLDIERLKELRAATGIPLVLHGGSGIPISYVEDAVKNGIAKINIATDIRQPYERVLAETGDVKKAQAAVADATGRLIREVYHLQGSASTLSVE